MQKIVYFNHGKESGPNGSKIQAMAEVAHTQGYLVESPNYSGMKDPQQRVAKLLSLRPAAERLVLVGSSMGSYVATQASQSLQVDGLFLLAPAFYIPEYGEPAPPPKARHCTIVHGWNDELIPVGKIYQYAQQYQIPLHILADGHRLTEKITSICQLFAAFLMQLEK
ncbi:MAG: YqiA/YcfP family alpha/beta fold hydrolase [Spirochaetota bacterium]